MIRWLFSFQKNVELKQKDSTIGILLVVASAVPLAVKLGEILASFCGVNGSARPSQAMISMQRDDLNNTP